MALSRDELDDLTRRGAQRGIDLAPGLELVERRLREQAEADHRIVGEAARHLAEAGGKRFRPMLVLLAGAVCGAPTTDPRLIDAGAVVELVHLSTLYHDDVIDGADVRRGAPTAQVRWSNTVAILTGDWLLARASALSAALGVEVTRIMAATIAELCEGQILEVETAAPGAHGADPVEATRGRYRAIVEAKTASLIAASCRLGALLGGGDGATVEALAAYGRRLGVSFQLADDVLDLSASPEQSGKVPGTDLREGVRTLPVILALEQEGPGSALAGRLGAIAAAVSAGRDPDEDDVAAALRELRAHPALGRARDEARAEAERATQELAGLPDEVRRRAGDALERLADYAVARLG